ncbi:hypothetical protein FRB96_004050 [Tulasnella sp. 330]|nr:hypothetical protein FRB96_004050 [Tulasnella sp. 330]
MSILDLSAMISATRLFALRSFTAAALALESHAPYVAQRSLGETNPVVGSTRFNLPENAAKWSSPTNGLSALNSDTFTTLLHPAFPEHSVRIKQVDHWCEPTAKSYSGYIDFQAKHLFFYFFESRNDPASHPLLMWINGGPGGSSSIGLFMELAEMGRMVILAQVYARLIRRCWNSNASVLFLDQPVGVGFSYVDYRITVSTTEEAARDIYAFIFLFMENFSEFKGREVHLSGESYGGRYLPLFATEIVDSNAIAVKAGYEPINLKQLDSWVDMQCANASYPGPPVQGIANCVRMRTTLPRCKAMLKAECVDRFDLIGCTAANDFCTAEYVRPYTALGLNPFDITKKCIGDNFCYPIIYNITQHLNIPDVWKALGVDATVPNFQSGSEDVAVRCLTGGDRLHDTSLYVAELLERGIKVLLYAGALKKHPLIALYYDK